MSIGKKIGNFVEALKGDYIILSLGSYGQDVQQLLPDFVQEILEYSIEEKPLTVSVLNIDSNFDDICSQPQSLLKTQVDGLEALIYKYTLSYNETKDDNKELTQAMQNILDKTNKKLILLNHMSVDVPNWIVNFVQKNNDKMMVSFEYIGSYFSDIPVVRYEPNLFGGRNSSDINDLVKEHWSKWVNKFDSALGTDYQYSTMATSELEGLREQSKEIGVLYRNLTSLPFKDLFNKNIPAKILGLTEAEHAEYIKGLMSSLSKASPLVDAAEKGLLDI